MFQYLFQQFAGTFVNAGMNDQTNKYEWITEEGRLRMIGASNDTLTALNMSTNACKSYEGTTILINYYFNLLLISVESHYIYENKKVF